jgi:hypothetical protein
MRNARYLRHLAGQIRDASLFGKVGETPVIALLVSDADRDLLVNALLHKALSDEHPNPRSVE